MSEGQVTVLMIGIYFGGMMVVAFFLSLFFTRPDDDDDLQGNLWIGALALFWPVVCGALLLTAPLFAAWGAGAWLHDRGSGREKVDELVSSEASQMNAQELTEPFLCDVCRIEHPESDLGKNVAFHQDHEGCTGRLCKRCTHGDMNRAVRRAMGKDATCRTACKL